MNLKYEVGQKVPVIHSSPVFQTETILNISVGKSGAKYGTSSGAYTEDELDNFAKTEGKPAEAATFDWDAFKAGKIAVHCDTEEKAKAFLKECEERGYKWGHSGSPLTSEANWGKNICYSIYASTFGICTTNWHKKHGYTVIDYPFSEQQEQPVKRPVMVTMDILEKLGACEDGKVMFQRYFPGGGELEKVIRKAYEVDDGDDAIWLDVRRYQIKAMQGKQEPVKLYCVKDFRNELIKGKVYEFDGHQVNYEHTNCFHAKDFDAWKSGDPGYSACLVPLVKRPAKVGEWVLSTKGTCCTEKGKIYSVLESPWRLKDDSIRVMEHGAGGVLQSCDYLVLDGYSPEPEKEPEPEYYSGKVVCIFSDDRFTVGKVYEFVNGRVTDNDGDLRPADGEKHFVSVDEWNSSCYGTLAAKFIEFKG